MCLSPSQATFPSSIYALILVKNHQSLTPKRSAKHGQTLRNRRLPGLMSFELE